jgi:hypothetical protein
MEQKIDGIKVENQAQKLELLLLVNVQVILLNYI